MVNGRDCLSVHRPDNHNKAIQDQSGGASASTPVKRLLQEAARACHKNVSEFLLDAGVTAAAQTLADRRQFASWRRWIRSMLSTAVRMR